MSRLREIWDNWQTRGLPRCWALIQEGRHCHRLIWPWQAWSGDGESAYHADCMARERVLLDAFEIQIFPPVGTL